MNLNLPFTQLSYYLLMFCGKDIFSILWLKGTKKLVVKLCFKIRTFWLSDTLTSLKTLSMTSPTVCLISAISFWNACTSLLIIYHFCVALASLQLDKKYNPSIVLFSKYIEHFAHVTLISKWSVNLQSSLELHSFI